MVIKKLSNGNFGLFSLKTGKKIGEYKSKEGAIIRERQINYFKHRRK